MQIKLLTLLLLGALASGTAVWAAAETNSAKASGAVDCCGFCIPGEPCCGDCW